MVSIDASLLGDEGISVIRAAKVLAEARAANAHGRHRPSLYPDESISSWLRRTHGIRGRVIPSEKTLTHALRGRPEPDFGRLNARARKLSPELLTAVQMAAEPPASYVLPARLRTLVCVWCQRDDLVLGLQPYERRSWAVAWTTACPRHGCLQDLLDRHVKLPTDVFLGDPSPVTKCVIRAVKA